MIDVRTGREANLGRTDTLRPTRKGQIKGRSARGRGAQIDKLFPLSATGVRLRKPQRGASSPRRPGCRENQGTMAWRVERSSESQRQRPVVPVRGERRRYTIDSDLEVSSRRSVRQVRRSA